MPFGLGKLVDEFDEAFNAALDIVTFPAELTEDVLAKALPWPFEKALFPIPTIGEVKELLEDPSELINPFELAKRLITLRVSPILNSFLVAYISYLEIAAKGKWKRIPPAFAERMRPFFAPDRDVLSDVPDVNASLRAQGRRRFEREFAGIRYAESINTLHGKAIVFGDRIFLHRDIDLENDADDRRLLAHEIQHTRQYSALGGLEGFLLEYEQDVFEKIVTEQTFDLHDLIDLEEDAIRVGDMVRNGLEMGTRRGRLRSLRVHRPGSRFGSGAGQIDLGNQMDVDVVLELGRDRPAAFGFQLRAGEAELAHASMLDLARLALVSRARLQLHFVRHTGHKNGHIIHMECG